MLKTRYFSIVLFAAALIFAAAFPTLAQKASPIKTKLSGIQSRVKRIGAEELKALLKPKGKPLVVNFWATWCDPCREEFPDLVKLDTEFKGKIDLITVSLDDLEDIDTIVPKFLKEVNAEMPAYLLKTTDDDAAIRMVSPDWEGNLPMTIIFNADGSVAYKRAARIRYEVVKSEIEKLTDHKLSQLHFSR